MLRIGMRTLNGKARQTAVAAFAHMPPPCRREKDARGGALTCGLRVILRRVEKRNPFRFKR